MSLLTVEEQLRTALLANGSVAAALPGGLYHIQLPQQVATYPAGTFQRISTQRDWVNAAGGQFSDFGWIRFQMDVWSDRETRATDVLTAAQAIITALRTFSATGQGGSNRVLNQATGSEPNTQPPLARCRLDLQVWFADNT